MHTALVATAVQTPTADARDQSHHLVYGMLAHVTLDGRPVVPMMNNMEGLPRTRLLQLVEDRLSQIVPRFEAERIGNDIVESLVTQSAPSTRVEIIDLLVPHLSGMLASLGLPCPTSTSTERPFSRRGRRGV
jgi:hypothetical protein